MTWLENGAAWLCIKYLEGLESLIWLEFRGKMLQILLWTPHILTDRDRKLLLCASATQDFNSARDIFGSMSDVAKNEPMTRFLMYKIAIRCEEVEFAAECLQIISSSSVKDSTLLYACVLDAQQIGDKVQTLTALQLVLENFGHGAPSTIHLPSLLRLTIGLTVMLLDKSEGSSDVDDTVEKLCNLYEGGGRYMLLRLA